ncbi:hypothetical protein EBT25_06565 [bacterium]|nr:hypothetical protein [bacterium]
MATQVQFRRGTTFDIGTFVGAIGEVVVDTTKKTVVVNDGSTPGGYPLLREDFSNAALISGTLANPAIKFQNSSSTGIYSPNQGWISLVASGIAGLTIDSSGAISIPGNVAITGNVSINGTFNSTDNLALIVALG